MKKLAIFISTYNGEKYLIELLGSIYKSSKRYYNSIEVYIINNDSNDNTKNKVLSFIKNHALIDIKYNKNKKI